MKRHINLVILLILGMPVFVAAQQQPDIKTASFGATIDHVTLHVQNFSKSVEFYRLVLQLERIEDPFKDDRHAFFRLGPQTELHILGGRKKPTDDDIDVHFALRVPSIHAFRDHLQRYNVKFYSTRRELGGTTTRPDGVLQIYLKDPDGYWIEVNDRKVK